MAKKDLDELLELCDGFDADKEDVFSEIVRKALKCGIDKVELAEECGVAGSTIDKWAKGKSCPGSNVQRFIVGNIQYLLEKA